MSAGSPGAGDYLRPGSDQARLLGRMANGHARFKHGADLGPTSVAAYQALVTEHLSSARLGFAVTGTDRRPRYLIADTENEPGRLDHPAQGGPIDLFHPAPRDLQVRP